MKTNDKLYRAETATSNCYAEVCAWYARKIKTKDCTVAKEELAKCANCAGNHRASSTLCSSYRRRVQMTSQQQQEKPKPNYLKADLPKSNQQQQQHQVRSAASASESNASAKNRVQSGANDIFTAMKGLNEVCSVAEMLRAISDLTSALSACQNKQEKFIAFVKFTENLDNYAL
ncbi:hypothetical protein Zmor_000644 [Zophobas morio]|uniref:Uncharacterized protein n=1 Tax=Zophobas morio TaxID=2755281 RepID=A0AA38J137_9CUCU|nr:hypothetical protein Zmor_000644 [Zophobas morio]